MSCNIKRAIAFYNEDPSRWSRFFSRNARHKMVPWQSVSAVSWCIEAISYKFEFSFKEWECVVKAAKTFKERINETAGDHIGFVPRQYTPSEVNDWLDFDEVIQMLEIAKEEYGKSQR